MYHVSSRVLTISRRAQLCRATHIRKILCGVERIAVEIGLWFVLAGHSQCEKSSILPSSLSLFLVITIASFALPINSHARVDFMLCPKEERMCQPSPQPPFSAGRPR